MDIIGDGSFSLLYAVQHILSSIVLFICFFLFLFSFLFGLLYVVVVCRVYVGVIWTTATTATSYAEYLQMKYYIYKIKLWICVLFCDNQKNVYIIRRQQTHSYTHKNAYFWASLIILLCFSPFKDHLYLNALRICKWVFMLQLSLGFAKKKTYSFCHKHLCNEHCLNWKLLKIKIWSTYV